MNDLIRLVMEQAAADHGSRDGSFTSRRFGHTLDAFVPGVCMEIPDGLVRVILTGRPDVEILGEGKYRIKINLQKEPS